MAKTNHTARQSVASSMRTCFDVRTNGDLASNQAVAVIHTPKDEIIPAQSYYVAASRRAKELFGAAGQLVGRSLEQFIADRHDDMPAYQFNAFFKEQATLPMKAAESGPVVVARIPMVIYSTQDDRGGPSVETRHPIKAKRKKFGRAFLPIIVDYRRLGKVQEYTVLYLDVTSSTRYMHDNRYGWCFVSGLDPWSSDLEIPPDMGEKDRTDRVFLAYNSKDVERVRVLDALLQAHGCDPWFDERCLKGTAPVNNTIEEALGTCRAALVFCGRRGYGTYQGGLELPMLLNLMQANKGITVYSVLLDGLREPRGLIGIYPRISYNKACTGSWVRGFLRDIMLV